MCVGSLCDLKTLNLSKAAASLLSLLILVNKCSILLNGSKAARFVDVCVCLPVADIRMSKPAEVEKVGADSPLEGTGKLCLLNCILYVERCTCMTLESICTPVLVSCAEDETDHFFLSLPRRVRAEWT